MLRGIGPAGLLALLAGCTGQGAGDRRLLAFFPDVVCYLEGVRFAGDLGADFVPLTVGETRSFAAQIGPPDDSVCPRPLLFTRLEWTSGGGGGAEPVTEARLVACGACTLLYEGRREPHQPVKGAALLHALEQQVVFEVTGAKPGIGSLSLIACLEEHCVEAAWDQLAFRVTGP